MAKKTQVPQSRECELRVNNSPNPTWTEKTFMISSLGMDRNNLG